MFDREVPQKVEKVSQGNLGEEKGGDQVARRDAGGGESARMALFPHFLYAVLEASSHCHLCRAGKGTSGRTA